MSESVGRYRKIYPRVWRHPGFLALKPSARELVLYLLSGPQTNAIGLFHFSVATAAEDLGVSVETLRKGLADVGATFGWFYDADARVIYIPSWWRWNKPENQNVLSGNLKALSEIPSCGLVDAFAVNVQTLPETLRETFMEGCRIRLPKRPPIQEQEQEQEQVSGTFQEQEHEQEQKTLRTEKRKNGIDGSNRLLPFARETLKLNHRDAPIDVLVDTFRHISKEPIDRSEVIRLINVAIQESRPS